MATPADDDMTELVDADFPRVDLVGKGANGIPRFLIAKQDESAGLLDAGFVRDLIAKAEPGTGRERVQMPNGITLSGSPAEMASFIHKAAQRRAEAAEVPQEDAVAVAAVAKDTGPELDTGVDGMDPAIPLAAPDGDAPGDPTDPGSPAWEAIDAATAQKWTSIAVRLKNALGVLAEREMLEAASADPDDIENAFDLEDAQCAVDYVIATLAVFAAGEQAEADLCGEAMEAIGKALGGFDVAPLDVIEGLVGVAKSGRVLSTANETHIREAAARLNTVLSSLPQAPVTEDGQPVAKEKETAMAETVTAPVVKDAAPPADEQAAGTASGDAPGREVAKSALALVYDQERHLIGVTDAAAIVQQVTKADGEKPPMQAVFDQNGDLIGIVAPDAIQPVTGAGKPPADGADSTDAADADASGTDMTPAPPAETGTPADAVADDGTVAKSSDSDVYQAIESIVTKAVAAALGERAPAQDIAKQADVVGLSEQVETLKARLKTVEEQPAAQKVFTNGQVPPANQLRGQDQGAAGQVDVAKARARKAELYAADAPEQARIAKEMQQDAVDVLAAMHAGR